MRNLKTSCAACALAVFIAGPLLPAGAAESGELAAIREQIRLLEQKLVALEQRSEAATQAGEKGPALHVSDDRVELKSADGETSLRLRGLVQADSRWYSRGGAANNDSFILRRARLIMEGRFNRIFAYQLVPEFGGNTGTLLDANLTITLAPGCQINAGKFKVPVGLEQLQPDSSAFFAERSLATALTPNRDVGIQLQGTGFDGRLDYALGVFNGQPDGGTSNNGADFSDGKTAVLRLFAHPFTGVKGSVLHGLGLGIAAGTGHHRTAAGRTSGYRTDGQQTFFTYRTTTVADGTATVFSPQAYCYAGPLGVLAEYVVSSVDLRNGAKSGTISNTAWNLSLGCVLTGENASYRGVKPRERFDPGAGTWGAFELVARISGMDIDDAVFAGGNGSLADAASTATRVTSGGLGFNWYLSNSVRTSLDVFRSDFDLPADVTPADRSLLTEGETVLITRLQMAF